MTAIKDAENLFEQVLAQEAVTVIDGGLATEMESQGHNINSNLWSAKMLVTNPRAIVDAHRAFLDAGARCIISASYQASQKTLADAGLPVDVADKVIVSSVELAISARDEFLADNATIDYVPIVAASIGPFGAALYNGAEYTGEYGVDANGLQEFHAARLNLLDRSGADVLAVETIPNATEAMVLCEILKNCRTPAWVSFCCRDDEHLSDGTPLRESAALFRNHERVKAIGINCTSPKFVTELIGEIRRSAPDKAVIVYPNSGETYRSRDNTWHGTASPLECADAALEWRNAGARLIGGCCRMGPQHIAAMREKLGVGA